MIPGPTRTHRNSSLSRKPRLARRRARRLPVAARSDPL